MLGMLQEKQGNLAFDELCDIDRAFAIINANYCQRDSLVND